METASLQILSDREAIKELRYTFAQGLDYQDWDLVESLFTDEVDTDFTLWGMPPQRVKRRDYVNTFKQNLSREGLRTQHLFSNFRISVAGDRATSRVYQLSQHYISGFEGGEEFYLRAEYLDTLVRTGDGWKFSGVTLAAIFYTSGNPAILAG